MRSVWFEIVPYRSVGKRLPAGVLDLCRRHGPPAQISAAADIVQVTQIGNLIIVGEMPLQQNARVAKRLHMLLLGC